MGQGADGTSAKLTLINWDAILDDAFKMGSSTRITRENDWQVITGMQVNLPDILNQGITRSGKLFILADTVDVGKAGIKHIDLSGFDHCWIFATVINRLYDARFLMADPPTDKAFSVYLRPKIWGHPGLGDGQWSVDTPTREGMRIQKELPGMVGITLSRSRDSGKTMPEGLADVGKLPWEACKEFLCRIQLAAQSEADAGRTEIASQLIDKLQQTSSLFRGEQTFAPGEQIFSDMLLQCAALRESLQPVRLESDHVPYLSPSVYARLATAYGPALKAFADTFANFMNRSFDLAQRKAAGRMMLDERGDALKFQSLVSSQLSENLRIAKENVSKAQQSITSQEGRVQQAASTFQSGMESWKREQDREAALAIVSGVLGFLGGMASLFTGNPKGAADAANGVAEAAKTASKLAKLAELMQKLVKIGKVIAKVVQLCAVIYEAAGKISNAKDLAERMSAATLGSNSEDMQDAPSAGAYWDQLWVEVETQLTVPVQEQIDGASEYLKELKILVIYGRALTTAYATLPPIMQEIARANLQAEIANRQRASVEQEIGRLEAGQAATGQAAAPLWLRYRMVQRSMLVALLNYDAARRYWALSDTRIEYDQKRSIHDIARALLEIADIEERQREALQSFSPPPQDFSHKAYPIPQPAIDEFLETGELVLRFTPRDSPFKMGRAGRVRVKEIFVWVNWLEGRQPSTGQVEFTVRTNGIYVDQRLEAGKVKSFCFVATPLNLTFLYGLEGYSGGNRYSAIRTPASVAKEFRTSYSEPTLFTEWRLSLPRKDGEDDSLDLAAFSSALKGITVEFSGTFIKDTDRFV